MGLPPLYYDGCDNPPHPEVRIDYFLHMVKLYSSKAVELVDGEAEGEIEAPILHLSAKEKDTLVCPCGLLARQQGYDTVVYRQLGEGYSSWKNLVC